MFLPLCNWRSFHAEHILMELWYWSCILIQVTSIGVAGARTSLSPLYNLSFFESLSVNGLNFSVSAKNFAYTLFGRQEYKSSRVTGRVRVGFSGAYTEGPLQLPNREFEFRRH